MKIYVVRPGDTVDTIAISQGTSPQSIIYDNQLVYPYPLAVGQALLLSQVSDIENDSSQTFYSANVGGYAYPFISRWVLEQTLI